MIVKARVRPTHNYGGSIAGAIVEVDDHELVLHPDVLELYDEEAEAKKPKRPTLADLLAQGCPADLAERELAHELLDFDNGWGRYRVRPLDVELEEIPAEHHMPEGDGTPATTAPATLEPRELVEGEKLGEGSTPAGMTSTPITPPAAEQPASEKITQIMPPKGEVTKIGKTPKPSK